MDNESREMEFTYESVDYVAVKATAKLCDGCAFDNKPLSTCEKVFKMVLCASGDRKDGIERIFVKK
ncbi:MAG: hypothetical protein WC714_28485 [Candidatus Obscuribacterales bacterium]|jgi:hypothetical protein